ncbi:MAG: hypothetical protein A2X28_03370 [Elusimicrobia bacterium GWA2_56_46]|nr:MAG: hypothetical protein A2X28_03370 [Elusimicrobia bacterium GWA2_56_46]OGR54210.1 MAG: hypothetical protein A2X39_09015 [Elusimicrobia bacterium GWC2_56_31]HBB68278.1 hypothetical protein [Elusimicrobiota bacterium]HBW21788.1 hypothetical protein [Elusimicrobiota bacterium]
METDDFEEILKETELDSAKMIFRLTSELKGKELELASLRTKSFEEIQRNNKAKEAEFEALIEAQEARIQKRESELARVMVEKEASLWQKHQTILEAAIAKHRAELEEERGRLNAEVARKETEVLEQKKNLRAEMETLFRKWETEREEDFKNERKTFLEELKLGRETARKEAEDRARQMEELWKEKLAQNASELEARHQLELEEVRSGLRREHIAALKELSARRQAEWEQKHAELKKSYLDKEAGIEASAKEWEAAALETEKKLIDRHAKLEKELLLRAEKLRAELAQKEKALGAEFAANTAELQERFDARERLLAERETKLSVERGELNRFRSQIADTIHQRETELAGAFEERYALLKESLEESARIKELGLARKYEEARRQLSILAGQKDAALARAGALTEDGEKLKRLLAEKDAELRAMEEAEHARASQLRKKMEEEFDLKVQAMRAQLAAGEESSRKNFEERLRTETARLADQYRIKETGLAAQRDLMNAQAGELEAKFMDALKAKELENSVNIRKALDGLNAQLETAGSAHARELEEVRRRAEETVLSQRAELEARLREKELQHEQAAQTREKQAFAAARRELELEAGRAEENYQTKLLDLESRHHILEQNLKFAGRTRDESRALAAGLKEEIERLNIKLDETENERQKLIQDSLSRAKDLRQAIEKEFLDKLEGIEKNYLGQLADTIRRGEDREKNRQEEYFKKLEFIKEEYAARLAERVKEMEDSAAERENRMRAALESGYKLKAKALATRYEQLNRNYEALLSDKTMQLDNDRSAAESISRLKAELEARNRELNSKILERDKELEEAKQAQEISYAAAKKKLEDDQRMKTAQLENERVKLKGLLEQEQRLVLDLQKREAALQESYAAKEAALAKEFGLAKEKLEKDYQAKQRS